MELSSQAFFFIRRGSFSFLPENVFFNLVEASVFIVLDCFYFLSQTIKENFLFNLDYFDLS